MTAKTVFGMNHGLRHEPQIGTRETKSMSESQVQTVTASDVTVISPAEVVAPTAPAKVEIRWLANSVQSARAAIQGIREGIPQLTQEAAALHATVQDIRKQISDTHDDLKFEAGMGNGSSS